MDEEQIRELRDNQSWQYLYTHWLVSSTMVLGERAWQMLAPFHSCHWMYIQVTEKVSAAT